MKEPIKIWEFLDAPEDLQLPFNRYTVAENGTVFEVTDDYEERETTVRCPNYIGYTIIIPCHA